MANMQIFGLLDERPLVGQLRRIECERACDELGVEYNNTSDGAYVLQRRLLSAHDEMKILKAAGRSDLLPEKAADEEMAAKIEAQGKQIDEVMEINRKLMKALEAKGIATLVEPLAAASDEAVAANGYRDWDIRQLRAEVKSRGMSQSREDTAPVLRQRLMDNDTGQSPELEHEDGDAT